MRIAYARVSTRHQNLEMQVEAFRAGNCENIFIRKNIGL